MKGSHFPSYSNFRLYRRCMQLHCIRWHSRYELVPRRRTESKFTLFEQSNYILSPQKIYQWRDMFVCMAGWLHPTSPTRSPPGRPAGFGSLLPGPHCINPPVRGPPSLLPPSLSPPLSTSFGFARGGQYSLYIVGILQRTDRL